MIKVGIVGAAGYTAGELIRILVNHPEAEIAFAHSQSNAGKALYEVHEGLIGDTGLHFCSEYELEDIDVLFLCGAHGRSSEFWQGRQRPEHLKVIDLAQDFRDESNGYVYGLPEWKLKSDPGALLNAQSVANPGCFATAIQLALLPLSDAGLLKDEVQVTAITGSTGAGAKLSETSHFSWRNNNVSSYKVFEHQHLIEIRRNLSLIQGPTVPRINFVPVRGDFPRGIFASLHTRCELPEQEIIRIFREYFQGAAFTFVSELPVDLKQVTNTNKCVLHIEKHQDTVVITSVIDNLLKGASGQAVQNMNLIFGLDQSTGLKFKASAF